jgi:hypothetical protein
MPEIAWRGTNEFGDFVGVLEFRAIYFNHGLTVPEQGLRCCLHDARLPHTGRPQKQEVPYRTARCIQSRTEHLIKLDQCLYCSVLPDNSLP